LDNGTEFHGYKALEDRFPMKCYFATPYHSWERGSNENLNGLIRQYLPKGVCMSGVTQAHCDYVALKLNSRPRKRHGYRTPQEVYDEPPMSCTSRLNPRIFRFWLFPYKEVPHCNQRDSCLAFYNLPYFFDGC
jgi:hypothetical protein